MTNVSFDTIKDYRDVETLSIYHELVDEKGFDSKDVLAIIHAKSRDNARTPMQWDDSQNAGFTAGSPWIKVNPNYKDINVKSALEDPNSIFHYYQKLIQLRRQNPVIVYGAYDLVLENHDEIYAFTRTLDHDRLLVILNFTKNAPVFKLPFRINPTPKLIIANYEINSTDDIHRFTLRPYEARSLLLAWSKGITLTQRPFSESKLLKTDFYS